MREAKKPVHDSVIMLDFRDPKWVAWVVAINFCGFGPSSLIDKNVPEASIRPRLPWPKSGSGDWFTTGVLQVHSRVETLSEGALAVS